MFEVLPELQVQLFICTYQAASYLKCYVDIKNTYMKL